MGSPKHLTLHPSNDEGTIDGSIDIYPKVLAQDVYASTTSTDPMELQENISVVENVGSEETAPGILTKDSTATNKVLTFDIIRLKKEMAKFFYPVGSIYISLDSSLTNPNTALGFDADDDVEWQEITGRFLYACDNSITLGSTGGSKNAIVVQHNHAASFIGIPTDTTSAGSHTHDILTHTVDPTGDNTMAYTVPYTSSTVKDRLSTTSAGSHTHRVTASGSVVVNSNGSSGINANMPPYLAVKMWQRTN